MAIIIASLHMRANDPSGRLKDSSKHSSDREAIAQSGGGIIVVLVDHPVELQVAGLAGRRLLGGGGSGDHVGCGILICKEGHRGAVELLGDNDHVAIVSQHVVVEWVTTFHNHNRVVGWWGTWRGGRGGRSHGG